MDSSWKPAHATISAISMPKLCGLLIMHAGAIAAPFYFSWEGFWCFLILVPVTGHLGISLGFHRLLSHRSFETPRPIKYALAVLGTLTLQAGPVTWVALHRLHHQKSDQPDDPHTPFYSLLWPHITWTLFPTTSAERDRIDRRAKDIARDPMLAFLNDHNWLICLSFLAGLFVIGTLTQGIATGFSCVLWGGCLRTICVWHMTFMVNSWAHFRGYRNYATRDDSHNSVLVSLFMTGDGWHNNHHAYPKAAGLGHRPCELDPLYWVVLCMARLGLASKVIAPPVYVPLDSPASTAKASSG